MALTLKRRHLETIVYLLPDGRRITATVVSPDTVKISSEAPSDVQILRGELAPPPSQRCLTEWPQPAEAACAVPQVLPLSVAQCDSLLEDCE